MRRLILPSIVALGGCAMTPHPQTRQQAVALGEAAVAPGDTQQKAVRRLQHMGFKCRVLAPSEYYSSIDVGKVFNCHIEVDRTAEGYTLAYVTLAIDKSGHVASRHADSYPVLFRNLRVDDQGRTVVVPDQR